MSHSNKDTWIASMMAKCIEEQGGKVWLDTIELSGGDSINREIVDAIYKCEEAIVLISPYSVSSQWVIFEMGAISGQRKRLTPILSHVGPGEVPILPNIKCVDINLFDQTFLPELARRIEDKQRSTREG